MRAPSNQAQAGLVTDQDHNTYWQPDLDDPLQKWWLEIDLDRAVVARKIRVIFPQTEDARPFEFFSVHVSPGIQVAGAPGKQIAFERVGRPVNNNTKQVVEFDLRTANKSPPSGTPKGQYLAKSDSLDFSIFRFVRFEAAGQTAGAALAEIEVDGIGFNLSTRVFTEVRAEKGEASHGAAERGPQEHATATAAARPAARNSSWMRTWADGCGASKPLLGIAIGATMASGR